MPLPLQGILTAQSFSFLTPRNPVGIRKSERTRILETYVVPEKSVEISRPPKTSPRQFDAYGHIEREPLGTGILFNRLTASWYLEDLRVQLEWRI